MKLTTNKSNWSGEEITVEVDRENLSWKQSGYEFHLEWVDYPEDVHHLIGKGYYAIRGKGWDKPLGVVNVDGEAHSGDLEREATDPIEAAVKLLCNFI